MNPKPTFRFKQFRRASGVLTVVALLGVVAWFGYTSEPGVDSEPTTVITDTDRSPVDLILSKDEAHLLTVNQTSNSVSLVHVESGKVLDEIRVGKKPSSIALTPDQSTVLVTSMWSGELTFLNWKGDKLTEAGKLKLGFEPRGVVVTSDGKKAYVALTTGHKIAVIDVPGRKVIDHLTEGGRWPRYLAITEDGKRLAVAANGDRGVSVVDTETRKEVFQDEFAGINIGQMQISKDNQHVYFPWMTYLANPITKSNITRGWVLASRIAKLKLDKYNRRKAIALDPRGRAVSDPHGLAVSPNEEWIVCAASGTHELLVFKLPGLPLDEFGPRDHIDGSLLGNRNRFYRIPLGGRPMFVRFSKDNRHVYVANYLDNSIQVVDITDRKVARTIPLGSAKEVSLARKGETIFYDGKRSHDQWYSCHSCHFEGHTSGMVIDTHNDGSTFTFKTVLSLRNVTRTSPWTWHGWQESLNDAMHKSMLSTMQGTAPKDDDVKAMIAYLDTLDTPPNPHRNPDGSFTAAAKRGKLVFESEKAGCARCHNGPYFTSKRTFDVGLSRKTDRYPGYNPPSLLGTFDRVLYLHDGRAKTLEETLTGPHAPHAVTNNGKLTETEMRDLIEYVKSL